MSVLPLTEETIYQLRDFAAAVRIGSERTEQMFDGFFHLSADGKADKACAVGAAWLRDHNYLPAKSREELSRWMSARYPCLSLTHKRRSYSPCVRPILHNDKFHWSREKIARYCERVARWYELALEKQKERVPTLV